MRKRYQLLNVDVDVDQQEKALLWTTAHTQDPQGTASVFLEMEKRILQWLKEIKNLLKQHAPQLLKVFKMRSLLVWFGLVWFVSSTGQTCPEGRCTNKNQVLCEVLHPTLSRKTS